MEKNLYYAGCNHWENDGKQKDQPKDTATAMHECGECALIPYCLVKQTSEVFPFTKEDAANFKKAWKSTKALALSKGHTI